MREIKFRAWNIEKREMVYLNGFKNGNNSLFLYHGKNDCELWIKDFTKLMQFTGLLDKNRKKIYEGDICIDNDSEDKVVVKFFDGAFWFCLDKDTRFTYDWIKKELPNWNCQVIGNIYENPTLLKKKN